MSSEGFYDEMWDRYGHLDATSPAGFHRRRLIVELCRKHAPSAKRVLDVGCGQGQLLRELSVAFPGATLSGSDVSRTSVAETKRQNPTLEILHMDLQAADFEAAQAERLGRFDVIVCSEVVEHLPDDALAVARLSALLAPRGKLVITVPGGKMSRFDQLIGHQRHYSVARLRELAEGAGLAVLDVLAWGFPFQNLYRSVVRLVSRVSLPSAENTASASQGRGVGRVLSAGYALFGHALKPLFYLNRSYWGEQMLLVAERR